MLTVEMATLHTVYVHALYTKCAAFHTEREKMEAGTEVLISASHTGFGNHYDQAKLDETLQSRVWRTVLPTVCGGSPSWPRLPAAPRPTALGTQPLSSPTLRRVSQPPGP